MCKFYCMEFLNLYENILRWMCHEEVLMIGLLLVNLILYLVFSIYLLVIFSCPSIFSYKYLYILLSIDIAIYFTIYFYFLGYNCYLFDVFFIFDPPLIFICNSYYYLIPRLPNTYNI